MILLNDKPYKLALIDTCVVSELLKLAPSQRTEYFNVMFDGVIPCFTAHNLKELRRSNILISKFVEMFRVLPSYFLKDHDLLLQAEVDSYACEDTLNAIIGPLFKNPLRPQDPVLIDIAEQTLTDEVMLDYNKYLQIVLDGILSLKNNYPPKGKKYSVKEIENFVWMVSFEQVVDRHLEWANQFRDNAEDYDLAKLPSLQYMSYVLFYKFYLSSKSPTLSDIPDLIMSSVYPYVDIVVVEKHQAEIARQIQRRHLILPDLEIMTLKDIE